MTAEEMDVSATPREPIGMRNTSNADKRSRDMTSGPQAISRSFKSTAPLDASAAHAILRHLPTLIALLMLPACALHYPMGLSKEQWNALPPSQQAEYQAKQYAIDAERQQQREARRLEQERLAQEQAIAKAAATQQAYARAQYGDIVTVNISAARMYYGNTRWPCQPVSFDLVKGERKQVQFTGFDPETPARRLVQSYWVSLSDDGHTFTFNDDRFGEKVVVIDDGWRNGRTYQNLGTPSGKRVQDLDIGNMTVTIRYRDTNDGQRVIIEHRN